MKLLLPTGQIYNFLFGFSTNIDKYSKYQSTASIYKYSNSNHSFQVVADMKHLQWQT